jgi:hypothetical protein
MRSFLARLGATASLVLIAGCDVTPNIELYNATGRTVLLDIAKGSLPPDAVRLEPGASRRVSSIYGPEFRLTFDGCERRYELPFMEMNEPWPLRDAKGMPYSDPAREYRYPVKVELGADDILYLLPSKAKAIASPAGLAPLQSHGYPLKPVSKACP